MFDVIEKIKSDATAALESIKDSDALQRFQAKYLSAKGELKSLMSKLKDVPADQKPLFGKHANDLRVQIQQKFDDLAAMFGAPSQPKPTGPAIDVTEPGLSDIPGTPAGASGGGRQHVITQTIDDLIEVFGRMGFDVATGPEIEDEYHNFVALNIPESHPARDPLDNFYLNLPHTEPGTKFPPPVPNPTPHTLNPTPSLHMLRSQTSTIQIRVMEKTQPPLRVVAMGRVYRPDEHDATHYSMFHQVEGLYVDRGVSMADLKTTLLQFAHVYFGPEAEIRLRPSFFPFTEPSAEMDVKMLVNGQWKWVELGGCGMVDPAVFHAVGYDPEQWTGFAFGLGIERLADAEYNIQDIRWLFENDARFLRQF